MNQEEFEFALQKLLSENPTPDKSLRNRSWRSHHKYRTATNLMDKTVKSGWNSKYLGFRINEDIVIDKGSYTTTYANFVILNSDDIVGRPPVKLLHSGVYIKCLNPSKSHQFYKRYHTKQLRRFRGNVMDGCHYKLAKLANHKSWDIE